MIVTLEHIKQEVGRLDEFHDEMLARKLTESEAIVIDYLKVADDAYGGPGANDFPTAIAAAVINVTRLSYEHPDDDPLSTAVKSILHRLRDPAIG